MIALVTQLVEWQSYELLVGGSSPPWSTCVKYALLQRFFLKQLIITPFIAQASSSL